jgi:hypothetical protein
MNDPICVNVLVYIPTTRSGEEEDSHDNEKRTHELLHRNHHELYRSIPHIIEYTLSAEQIQVFCVSLLLTGVTDGDKNLLK